MVNDLIIFSTLSYFNPPSPSNRMKENELKLLNLKLPKYDSINFNLLSSIFIHTSYTMHPYYELGVECHHNKLQEMQ